MANRVLLTSTTERDKALIRTAIAKIKNIKYIILDFFIIYLSHIRPLIQNYIIDSPGAKNNLISPL